MGLNETIFERAQKTIPGGVNSPEIARFARQDAVSSRSVVHLPDQRVSAAQLRLELLRYAANIDYAPYISPGD